MRILWADDKPEVVQAFVHLLDPLKPKIVHVADGVEALERLQEDFFDLVIVDLAMPPDEWGGLWLVQQIHDTGISVPVIIVSGEGSQTETIRALRLGARDYVRKDQIEMELIQRATLVLDEDVRLLEISFSGQAPTPIAVPLKRYVTALGSAQRLRRLVEFYEAVLRLTAILELARLRCNVIRGRAGAEVVSVSRLYSPSMGSWNQLMVACAQGLAAGERVSRMSSAISSKYTDRLTRIRNDLSHSADPSDKTADILIRELAPGLKDLLANLRQVKCQIIVPTRLDYRDSRFSVAGALLVGDSMALPVITQASSEPVQTNRAYLVPDDPADPWIELFPLILASPGKDPSAWEISVFDGIRGAHINRALRGNEPLRYIDVWSANRDVATTESPIANALRGVAGDWT